jgi:hypothetical protein
MIDSCLIPSQFANQIRPPGMKFLVIADRHAGTDPALYADEDSRRVRELTEDHTVEHFYLKADRSGAVFILEAESLEEAELAMESLAMAWNGLLDLTYSEMILPM